MASSNGFCKMPQALMSALKRTELDGKELRIFFAIMQRTIGFQSDREEFSATFLAKETGISKPTAARKLCSLVEQGMVICYSAPSGRRSGVYGPVVDPSQWRLRLIHSETKNSMNGVQNETQTTPKRDAKPSDLRRKQGQNETQSYPQDRVEPYGERLEPGGEQRSKKHKKHKEEQEHPPLIPQGGERGGNGSSNGSSSETMAQRLERLTGKKPDPKNVAQVKLVCSRPTPPKWNANQWRRFKNHTFENILAKIVALARKGEAGCIFALTCTRTENALAAASTLPPPEGYDD